MRQRGDPRETIPGPTAASAFLRSPVTSSELRRRCGQNAMASTREGGRVLSTDCAVCGQKANGYFFGALVCLPCKSFFIRCKKTRDSDTPGQCDSSCSVIKRGRIRCQKCRYLKCLAVGMVRKEKPEKVEPADGQILCLVCGDIANGTHFGIKTCEGCKKFFRRGLVEHKTYLCTQKHSCVINPRNRNNCRFCRYQKCVSLGMSRDAIKMGRPRKTFSPENDNLRKLSLRYCHEAKMSSQKEDQQQRSAQTDSQKSVVVDESRDSSLSLISLLTKSFPSHSQKGKYFESSDAGLNSEELSSCYQNTADNQGLGLPCPGNYHRSHVLDASDENVRAPTSTEYLAPELPDCSERSHSATSSMMSSSLPPLSSAFSSVSQNVFRSEPDSVTNMFSARLESLTPLSTTSPSDQKVTSTYLPESSLSSRSASVSSRSSSSSSSSSYSSSSPAPTSPVTLSPAAISPISGSSAAASPASGSSPFSNSASYSSSSSSLSFESETLSKPLSPAPYTQPPEPFLTTSEIENMLSLLTSENTGGHSSLKRPSCSTDSNQERMTDNYTVPGQGNSYVNLVATENACTEFPINKNNNENVLFLSQLGINTTHPEVVVEEVDDNNNGKVVEETGVDDSVLKQILFLKPDQNHDQNSYSARTQQRSTGLQEYFENNGFDFPNRIEYSDRRKQDSVFSRDFSAEYVTNQEIKSEDFDKTHTCCFNNIISAIEHFEHSSHIAMEDCYNTVKHASKENARLERNENASFRAQSSANRNSTPNGQYDDEQIKIIDLALIRDVAEIYAMDIT